MPVLNVGIVGLGRMGMSHYAIANAYPRARVAAVCESSGFLRGALERYTRVSCYKSLDTMLNEQPLDAVFITTPTELHFGMTRSVLEAGSHAFVEKPFCLTPREGLQLVEIASRERRVNQVGYHGRFLGTFREMQRLLALNAIGEVHHVLGEVYGPVVLRESKKTWRADPTRGGGCLYDYTTHIVNLMQFFMGPPKAVRGAVLQKIFSSSVPDAVYCTFDYANGASGQVRSNWSDDTRRKLTIQVTVFGTRGQIRADAQELNAYFRFDPGIEGYRAGWNVRWTTELSPNVGYYLRGEEYSAQVEYFLGQIERNNPMNLNSFAESQITDTTIEMIRKAASQGRA